MIDAALWQTLDGIQKKRMEQLINAEWVSTQENLHKTLILAAERGYRHTFLSVVHKENVERLETMFGTLEGFKCSTKHAQNSGYQVTIAF